MMHPIRRLLAASCLLLGACVATGSVETTLEKASVRAPRNVFGDAGHDFNAVDHTVELEAKFQRKRPQYAPGRLAALSKRMPAGAKLPVIVYFHGCAGILRTSIDHLDWLEKLDDFVVIAPNSFARNRPEYCFRNHTVDLSVHGDVTLMRQREIDFALGRIAALPWVDKHNIFLIGHSQGGGTVAGYSGPVRIRGRIILNGGCSEYLGGDGMKDDEALLTFDSGNDPWFRKYFTACRDYVLSHPKGKSIYEPDSISHNLVASFWSEVKAFLTKNRR